LNVRPIPEPCPPCGNPSLLDRERKSGAALACDKPGCGFERPAGDEALPPMREILLEAAPAPAGKTKSARATEKKAPRARAARAAPAKKRSAPARPRVKAS
jgi:hypothetical protein